MALTAVICCLAMFSGGLVWAENGVSSHKTGDDPVRWVDPFIGCAYNGHCFAAACVPFGMVQAGPDTGNTWWDYCSGYRFADTNIIGFSQTHLSGTGCGDLGDVRVMPVKRGLGGLTGLAYAKSEEVAEPGYYAVTLKDAAVRVEIAAAKHSAIYRFNPLDGETPRLFVDLQYGILNWGDKTGVNRVISCDVRKDGDRRIVGTVKTRMWVTRTFHFAMEFDRPIAGWEDCPNRDEREKGRRFVLSFANGEKIPLGMKFGISASSVAAAKGNLALEIPGWNFSAVRTAARNAWNGIFSRMVAEGTESQLRTFYTSLYHLFIQPNDIADVGEEPFYSTFSYWDTFRAAHPLYTIIAPDKVDGFVNSTLRQADRQGYMPVWTLWGKDNHCMIGNHSIPVVVDAYLKGFRSFDAEKAYAMIRKSLVENVPGRAFNRADTWAKYGYFPFDVVKYESVSRTLEHAYDDWCAARFAEALGKKEDAAFFAGRANNWTNVFDRSVGFARGRDSKGNWREPFSPFKLNVGDRGEGPKDFTEGNSWQYTWHVMQDPEGLMAAMGGRDRFLKNLDGLFSQPEQVEGMGFALDATGLVGQYAHGNEPSHHTAYLFTLAGRPDRTADVVREVCDRFYRPEPEGLCGNDDCGQMSAWYLFSAMGFYPVNPCGGDYVIGAPQVPRVQVKVKGEGERWNEFTVIAHGLSKENKYVKSVTLNGKPFAGHVLKHAQIIAGGELVFEMTNSRTEPKVVALYHRLDRAYWHDVRTPGRRPLGGYYVAASGEDRATERALAENAGIDAFVEDAVQAESNGYVRVRIDADLAVFERHLREAAKGGKVLIDSWNDFKSGRCLLPDTRLGDMYLRTVAKVFGRHPADEYVCTQMRAFWEGDAATNQRPCRVARPTIEDAKYGPHPRQGIDLWLPAVAGDKSPVVILIHGGGWREGDRCGIETAALLSKCRAAGVALATVGYRFIDDAEEKGICPPVRVSIEDAIAAIRFLKSNAIDWHLDQERIGLTGGSAGACSSLIAALTDDNSLGIRVVLAKIPQTSLDPEEMRAWIPNINYGARAFGYRSFDEWLAHRADSLPWIRRYSPSFLIRHIMAGHAPTIFYVATSLPPPGALPKDPTHAAMFCVKFGELCAEKGVRFEAGDDDGMIAELCR